MSKEQPEPLPADRLVEYHDQLKDLKPLVDRKDPVLSPWELKFLADQLAGKKAKTTPTVDQANKVNQIYEQKYLRGIHS